VGCWTDGEGPLRGVRCVFVLRADLAVFRENREDFFEVREHVGAVDVVEDDVVGVVLSADLALSMERRVDVGARMSRFPSSRASASAIAARTRSSVASASAS